MYVFKENIKVLALILKSFEFFDRKLHHEDQVQVNKKWR